MVRHVAALEIQLAWIAYIGAWLSASGGIYSANLLIASHVGFSLGIA